MADGKKLGLLSLIAIVIGSMIGGGAFNLVSDMAGGASAGAVVIGWVITGIGMIALAFCFQNLTNKRPDLEGGIFSYARAGFGDYWGFNSAWGYWLSAWLGNIAFLTLLFSGIGYFIPIFDGANLASIIGASVLLWLLHFLILRGVHSAALVNLVVTIGKLVPIFLFIILAIFAFKIDTFSIDFWGKNGFSFADLMGQTKSTMLVTLWVFIGIEGAVVLSSRAKNMKDVGKATVIGLISTLIIYILITVLSFGIMSQSELAGLKSPSMAYVLKEVVGPWGAAVVNLGLIVSLLGALLGWTLLAAELPYLAAKDGILPKMFAKENKNKAPVNALIVTNVLVQIFLLTLLISDKPYNFAFSLASSAILIPYLFSALYQVKYSLQHKERKQLALGIVATVYSVWLLYAAGISYLLLTAVLYALGIFVFRIAQKERGENTFKPFERIWALMFDLLAVLAIIMLIIGKISF
ncbi:arginine-ornithine antiporter [Neobacillus niacini]|uniref:arginine-ornithine antiporter n=1 Tax=Neobacillus niacini TaxID=86668 RepID=UPI0028627FD9|nr:arginine-ornithine antiporter [Neobacillus niacini]MDR7002207.1 arginine:ornithine antiporter/lysine permease [Neobacillus niacini]